MRFGPTGLQRKLQKLGTEESTVVVEVKVGVKFDSLFVRLTSVFDRFFSVYAVLYVKYLCVQIPRHVLKKVTPIYLTGHIIEYLRMKGESLQSSRDFVDNRLPFFYGHNGAVGKGIKMLWQQHKHIACGFRGFCKDYLTVAKRQTAAIRSPFRLAIYGQQTERRWYPRTTASSKQRDQKYRKAELSHCHVFYREEDCAVAGIFVTEFVPVADNCVTLEAETPAGGLVTFPLAGGEPLGVG